MQKNKNKPLTKRRQLKVYVFGNADIDFDNRALLITKKLRGLTNVEFVVIKPNEDLPFANGEDVVTMDVVEGLKEITLFQDGDLERIILPPRATAHDFDLGFQLKYLKKLDKLGGVAVIGLPAAGNINYGQIRRILKGLT